MLEEAVSRQTDRVWAKAGSAEDGLYGGLYWGNIIRYRDNGKENGSYYDGLGLQGLGV